MTSCVSRIGFTRNEWKNSKGPCTRLKLNQQSDCAPSEDSDQPGHPPSLIRVFAVRMKKAWVLSYPLSAQPRFWSDWADAQVDLSLRWAHSHFVGFVMSQLKFFMSLCKNVSDKIRGFVYSALVSVLSETNVGHLILATLYGWTVKYLFSVAFSAFIKTIAFANNDTFVLFKLASCFNICSISLLIYSCWHVSLTSFIFVLTESRKPVSLCSV